MKETTAAMLSVLILCITAIIITYALKPAVPVRVEKTEYTTGFLDGKAGLIKSKEVQYNVGIK
jgi:hypothetical protein